MNAVPLVDQEYLLQKFPGKGGWTYALIPEIPQDKSNPFGWVQVRGHIDNFEINQYKLMPMGDGKSLFLPVKAMIRKKIKKEAGDLVHIKLFLDSSTVRVPNEITTCLRDDGSTTYKAFMNRSQGEQKAFIDWINQAASVDTKVKRINEMICKLKSNIGFYD